MAKFLALSTAAAAFALLAACSGPAVETATPPAPEATQAAAPAPQATTTKPAAPKAAGSGTTAPTPPKAAGSATPKPAAVAQSPSQVYANILSKYVSQRDGINFFAYGKVTPEDHAALKSYIAHLEGQGDAGLSDAQTKAYWFNVYNAKTIDVILENYPLKSIRSLGAFNRGPWDKKVLNVKGKGEMSLNDVEHGTLRKRYKEPRIHYAVNCASYGCPNLKSTIWTAENLEADLEAAASAYVNHPRGVRVENGKVIASSIFDWYKGDFGTSHDNLLNHFRKYAKGNLATQLQGQTKISKFEYNWNLNE